MLTNTTLKKLKTQKSPTTLMEVDDYLKSLHRLGFRNASIVASITFAKRLVKSLHKRGFQTQTTAGWVHLGADDKYVIDVDW